MEKGRFLCVLFFVLFCFVWRVTSFLSHSSFVWNRNRNGFKCLCRAVETSLELGNFSFYFVVVVELKREYLNWPWPTHFTFLTTNLTKNWRLELGHFKGPLVREGGREKRKRKNENKQTKPCDYLDKKTMKISTQSILVVFWGRLPLGVCRHSPPHHITHTHPLCYTLPMPRHIRITWGILRTKIPRTHLLLETLIEVFFKIPTLKLPPYS